MDGITSPSVADACSIRVFYEHMFCFCCRVIPWLRLVATEDTALTMPQEMVVTAHTWQDIQPRFPVNVPANTTATHIVNRSFSGLGQIVSIPLLANDKTLLDQLQRYGFTGLADLILLDENEDLHILNPGRKSQRWAQLDRLSRRNCRNLKLHFGVGFRPDTFGSLARKYLETWGISGYMYITGDSTGLTMQYLILKWAEAVVQEHGNLLGNAKSLEDLARAEIEPLQQAVADGTLQPLVIHKACECVVDTYESSCLCIFIRSFLHFYHFSAAHTCMNHPL